MVAALIAIVVVVATGAFGGGGSSPGSADNAFATGVARSRSGSLSSQTQVSATLGYAGASTIVVPAGTAPSSLQQAQQAVATDAGTLQSAQADARLATRADAGPGAGGAGGRAGEGGGRLPRQPTPPQPSRRGLGGRRLGRDAVCERRADGRDRRAERVAGAAKVVGDQSQVLVRRARARRRAGALAAAQSSGGDLRSELDLHGSARRSGRSSGAARACTRSAASRSSSSTDAVAAWRAFMPGMSTGSRRRAS